MPVVDPSKQSRVQNLTAESRQKRKDKTQGNLGSRRKLAVAHRKVPLHATVA
jgi:hypothetical protein